MPSVTTGSITSLKIVEMFIDEFLSQLFVCNSNIIFKTKWVLNYILSITHKLICSSSWETEQKLVSLNKEIIYYKCWTYFPQKCKISNIQRKSLVWYLICADLIT